MKDRITTIFGQSLDQTRIPHTLYARHDVKKGLRNEDGTGVLVGLTRVSDVEGYTRGPHGEKIDKDGELYYRGIPLKTLYRRVTDGTCCGYEEICFLILFGHLPDDGELEAFRARLRGSYELSDSFFGSSILKSTSMHMMNKIQTALLLLYAEDETPDDTAPRNLLRQGLDILAKLPAIVVNAYKAKIHHMDRQSLVIHPVRSDLDLAESILYLLNGEDGYTEEQVRILDLMLILHADHGVGNNSTFTSLVVSSTDTDIYSAFSASVGSLKGLKHGGANITCKRMMDTVLEDIGTDASDEAIRDVVRRIIAKDYFDRTGLVYGIGHAVYTLSDPRCVLLKEEARKLAQHTGRLDVFNFYGRFEQEAVRLLREAKGRNLCANVDFYSGLIYDMLGIPTDLYTPMFVISRSVGWLAHIIEEKVNSGRIIRPAGLYISDEEVREATAEEEKKAAAEEKKAAAETR